MIDMGFEVDLNLILDSMPATFVKPDDNEALYGTDSFKGWRVTTLFSATMPPAVERLSRKYLRKPATVTIGDAGEAVDTVDQRVEFISSDEKKKTRLIEILRNGGYSAPIIVFVNQLRTADVVLRHVHAAGWSGVTLSSAKTQDAREAALKSVRDGEVQALVATDVAGRGIDIPDVCEYCGSTRRRPKKADPVALVINWQMADNIERYTHRIGRTGRAGKTGVAITFLSNDDDETFFELKNLIEKSPISKMNPELARHEGSKQKITKEMKRKRDEQD
jgi:ATP-dependent RNA helicase DDX23/PRP28